MPSPCGRLPSAKYDVTIAEFLIFLRETGYQPPPSAQGMHGNPPSTTGQSEAMPAHRQGPSAGRDSLSQATAG